MSDSNDAELIKLMRNYVCPRCFNNVDVCKCDGKAYYSLWWIDRGIQEHIRILNEKGYKTQYSCESHNPLDNLYIAFFRDNSFGKSIPIPDGFHLKGNGKTLEHIYGKDSKTRKKMTIEEFEVEKKKCLDTLLEWCKALPEQEKNKNIFGW